jgi:hypothetical protein
MFTPWMTLMLRLWMSSFEIINRIYFYFMLIYDVQYFVIVITYQIIMHITKFGLYVISTMIKLFCVDIIILLWAILLFQKIKFYKFHYMTFCSINIFLCSWFARQNANKSMIHYRNWQKDRNRQKKKNIERGKTKKSTNILLLFLKKTLKGCKTNNKIQTYKRKKNLKWNLIYDKL